MSPVVKRSLKIIAGLFSVVIVMLTITAVYIFMKLPAVGEMRKYIHQDQTPTKIQSKTSSKNENNKSMENNPTQKDSEVVDLVESSSDSKVSKKEVIAVIANNLANKEKPLVSVCKNLKYADQSQFLKNKNYANANYFMKSIGAERIEDQDVAIESAAPVLRHFFRVPGVDYVVDKLLKIPDGMSEEESSEFFQKAELMANLFKAYEYLKSHKAELNSVVQRSHDLNVIVKAVAARPDIANDPAVLNFCQQAEDNLNALGPYDAEIQKQELKKLLDTYQIDPKSINYDPNYKANVEINMSDNNLSLNDPWIKQLFNEDIKKAEANKNVN